ncbi:MAG: hypothetical protein ACI9ZF_001848 [Bradyrhizobium sp.]|jgi:hypothetical protein
MSLAVLFMHRQQRGRLCVVVTQNRVNWDLFSALLVALLPDGLTVARRFCSRIGAVDTDFRLFIF